MLLRCISVLWGASECSGEAGALAAHLAAMAMCLGALAAHLRAPAAYLGALAVHLGALAAHLGAVAAYLGALEAPLSSMRAFRTCAPAGNGGGESTFEDPSGHFRGLISWAAPNALVHSLRTLKRSRNGAPHSGAAEV